MLRRVKVAIGLELLLVLFTGMGARTSFVASADPNHIWDIMVDQGR